MELRLRPLKVEDEKEAIAAHRELEVEGFPFLLEWDSTQRWASYLARLQCSRRGIAIPKHRVPATFLVGEVEGALVGRVSIRHELNRFLADVGGHIGYAVRPHHRGRGVATEMLRQALIVARSEGVGRVLVTCDEDNPASAKVIERLGGVFDDVRVDPAGIRRRRYWIA